MFRAAWRKPWFRGAFFWKWYPHFDTSRSSEDKNFTPQGKPAEKVLGLWYSSQSVPVGAAASQP
jgi:hypothetical protein